MIRKITTALFLLLFHEVSSEAGSSPPVVDSTFTGSPPDSTLQKPVRLVVDHLEFIMGGSGQIRLRLEGAPNRPYIIQTSTNLIDWMPVVAYQIHPAVAFIKLLDAEAGKFPQRFYRVVTPAPATSLGAPAALAMDLFGFYPLAPPRNAMGALSAFSTAPFNPSRILIKPKPGVALGRLSPLQASLRGHVSREFPAMQNLRVVQLPAGSDVRSAIRNFQASGLVAYAEPDYLVHALAEPNDPRFQDGTLWNFRNTGQSGGVAGADIRATEGWDARATAENVIVAVVDTGIRYTHEDLALNLWKNPGEIPGNGLDDDGNGYVDDVHGINALRNDGDPMDDHGHGSHVSGIIGAVANNQIGVAGVAWKVRLMACKFINAQGDGAVSDAITCIDYARKHGAHIINGLQRRRRFHRDPHCRGR